MTEQAASTPTPGTLDVFLAFLRLGLTSFGGPVAHLGYFHNDLVRRRKWLSEQDYAELIAICQFLPGPASSQVGLAIGWTKAGFGGAFAAWLGFTAPSALLLIGFGYGLSAYGDGLDSGLLQGLKIAAVAVVAQALWQMSKSLCPDMPRRVIAVIAGIIAILWPTPWGQVGTILLGGLAGWVILTAGPKPSTSALGQNTSRRFGVAMLSIFFALLIGLPLISAAMGGQSLAVFDSFYRSGSLVFGGGHVVLPLLQSEVVPTGWVSKDDFLAGYGAAQAVPGPLFTFAAFLGTVMSTAPNGWLGGLLALVAIFVPSFLLVWGALPFWQMLRAQAGVQSALLGVNAAVVGLLLSAFYDPVWTNGIVTPSDFILAALAFAALVFWKAPSWLIVLAAAGAAFAVNSFGWSVPLGL